MDLRSLCPLPSALVRFRPRDGQLAMSVVCKATYRLEPGTASLHTEQEPLHARQKHYQDDPAQSIERPNDMIPFKPRAEVLVVGSAFVPRGQTARVLSARIVVGDLDKGVDVHGPRTLGLDGNVREGAGWSSMPLRYERAAGGPDTWNPIGVNTNWDQVYGTRALPQIVPRGHFSPNPFAPLPPIGLGPLSSQWPLRRDKLGARANSFSEETIESQVLGNDFDAHFFQCAPPDQWLENIRPDERIVLENLHVQHPRLVTSLPGLLPAVFLSVPGYAPMQIPMRPDTLLIDTDRGIATVTYRGQSLVTSFDAQGTFYLLLQEAGQTISVQQAQAMIQADTRAAEAAASPAPSTPTPDYQVTKSIRLNDLATRAPVMPFGQTPPAPASPPSNPRPSFDDDDDDDEEEQKQTNIYKMNVFQAPSQAAKAPRPRTRELPKSYELEQIISGAKSPLPFQGGSPSSPPPSTPNPPGQTVGLPFGTPAAPPSAPGVAVASTSAPNPAMPVVPATSPQPPAYTPPMPPNITPAPPPPVSVLQRSAMPALAGVASASELARNTPGPAFSEPTIAPYAAAPELPKTIGEMHVRAKSAGAPEGVLAASNAASVVASVDKPAQDKPAQDKPSADKPGPTLDVIWFEQSFLPRMRKQAEWSAFVRPAQKPTVPQRGQPLPPPPSADAAEEAAKADIQAILLRAQPARESNLVPGGAGDKDASLYLLAGTLTFPLDDIEMLKATAKAAAPLAANDKKLKEVLDTVDEVLKMPLEGAPEVVQSFLLKVREAWTSANKVLPPDYLVSHTERTLLNQRQYQKRELLDDEWIRALWSTGEGTSMPAYVPAKLAKRLPLFRQFPARILVEALPQQDMYETHPVALRVVTLARVLTPQEPQPAAKR